MKDVEPAQNESGPVPGLHSIHEGDFCFFKSKIRIDMNKSEL